MVKKSSAIGYLRPSTGLSLDAQDMAIRRYAEEHDILLVKCITDGEGDETALEELIRGTVGNPPIQIILAAHCNRIAPDVNMYFYYKYLLARKGVELVVVDDEYSEEEKNILGEFLVTAVREDLDLMDRKRREGQLKKAREGGYTGGRAPYGYDAIRGSGMLILNEKEAVMVRRIFELYDDKFLTYRAICEVIMREGYKTRSGATFSASTISGILNNRKLYEGYIKWGSDSWVKGKHPRILT